MSIKQLGILITAVALIIFGTGWYFLRPRTIEVKQPIRFNHYKHHVEMELSCDFCHQYVPGNSVAGLPEAEVCATCHEKGVQSDNPKFVEVSNIVAAHMETGEPIQWIRMYQIPPHVIFSHERHLEAHVECDECHGITGTSTTPKTEPHRVTMEYCVECHEKRRATVDCLACHK